MATSVENAIDWFNHNFQDEIEAKIAGTPFPAYFFTAIALKETYYIWNTLRQISEFTTADVLELCVGDSLDTPKRKAFPINRKAMEDFDAHGKEMFQIGNDYLKRMGAHIPGYPINNPNKFCHGYGIFQYDLQHYKKNSGFFLEKKWLDFDQCLDVCLSEVKEALGRAYKNQNKKSLTDIELVYVAIAYNRGSVDFDKNFKQGYFDKKKYYGEYFHDYLIASKLRSQIEQVVMFPVLRKGSNGVFVKRWQMFLIGQGFEVKGGADGDFGNNTEKATIAFQKKYKLDVDGEVGNQSYGQAAKLGFKITEDANTEKTTINYPPRPNFDSMVHTTRITKFGKFTFKWEPQPTNRENIRITDNWESNNIVSVDVPQLVGVRGVNSRGTLQVHKKIKDQLLGLWRAWEKQGLKELVLTCAGAFNARFKRGVALPTFENNETKLSNHSWGTAFDINAEWNGFGAIPALVGERGCVREMVAIANDYGFYWGGHFQNRPDGMHFEAAMVKTTAELAALKIKY